MLLQIALVGIAFAIAGFCLVLVELKLVKRLSSLVFAVLAILKELVVILLSVLIYKDTLSSLNIIGFMKYRAPQNR